MRISYVLDKVSLDSFYGYNLFGLFKILEKNPHIQNVNLYRYQACVPVEIETWELQNNVKLPKDMKNFYLSTNGFRLTWSYKFSGTEILPVGKIEICPLQELILLTGYNKTTTAEVNIIDHKFGLQLSDESKVFQLAHVDEESKVCLIYPNVTSRPTIWLADDVLCWHFMAGSFKEYFRMALVHIGLPYWQYCFTPQGVPAWVEQILLMDVPHLLNHTPYNIQTKNSIEREERMKKMKTYNMLNPEILQNMDPPHQLDYPPQFNYRRLRTRTR